MTGYDRLQPISLPTADDPTMCPILGISTKQKKHNTRLLQLLDNKHDVHVGDSKV